MITMVIKKQVNGRFVEFDANEMFYIGQVVTGPEKDFVVTNINRSRVDFSDVLENQPPKHDPIEGTN